MIRPEQLVISETDPTRLAATVESYEYYGHDAVARVRPEAGQLPDLVVRVSGGTPLVAGSRVGLSVQGSVVAWPIDEAHHTHEDGPDGHHHRHHHQDVTEK